jgi:hypothetical protein
MAHIKQVYKTKLVIGIMYSDKEAYEETIKQLTEKFGEIDNKSLEYDFNFTDYYEEETGKNLKKQIITFNKLIDRDELAEIKHFTNTIEDQLSKQGKRLINLDPGYMTEHNIVLASAKELPHKVSIGKGMFGDVVLEYRKGDYEDSRHTFPDFRTPIVKEFLKTIRKQYLQERK